MFKYDRNIELLYELFNTVGSDEEEKGIEIIINLVISFFNGDLNKTTSWFMIKNPLLGDMSPASMITHGRYKKLKKFIESSLNGI